MTDGASDRHPGTLHLLSLFEYEHLPPHLQRISKPIHDLAHDMVDRLDDGPELTTGLRHLWDAKNNLVMQAVIDRRERGGVEVNMRFIEEVVPEKKADPTRRHVFVPDFERYRREAEQGSLEYVEGRPPHHRNYIPCERCGKPEALSDEHYPLGPIEIPELPDYPENMRPDEENNR